MSSSLSRKELEAIVKDLERQGCRTRRTNSGGYFVFLPDGTSTTFHQTPSDARALANARSYVRRAGLSWLPDGKARRA